MRSRYFVRYFIATALVLVSVIWVSIAIIDPNDTLAFSPPLDRYPAATNQRFAYPSVARSSEFDSVILGTSTTRMLEPIHLNEKLGVRLANISMDSATWWEQKQILKLFLRHHEKPKLIIWGIDSRWCILNKKGKRLTTRGFPEWLYDEDKWNNYLHILNFAMIKLTGKQLGFLLGLRGPKYGKDGYASLNKKGTPYSLAKARRKIYGVSTPIPPVPALDFPVIDIETRRGWSFPVHETLEKLVLQVNKDTRLILMMVPYHQHLLGRPNASRDLRFGECKKRIYQLSRARPNVQYIDFMYRSPFTNEDKNYWDLLHFNEEGAKQIENSLIDFITKGTKSSKIYRTSIKFGLAF